jgi:hypothetical protein
MSYEVNDSDLFIPSKAVEIFPLARQDVRPNGDGVSQVQFDIDRSMGFFNPNTMKLRYTTTFQGRGSPHPSPSCGSNAFWRHQRIQTQDGLNILSETDELSSWISAQYSYTANDGMNNNRSLSEGLVNTTNSKNILFWEAQSNPNETRTTALTAKNVQINSNLYSGVFGTQIVPVGGMGGIHLVLQTNNTMKSVKTLPCDFKNAIEVKTTSPKASWNNADIAVNVLVQVKGNVDGSNDNHFVIGDKVYATDTNEASSFAVGVVVKVGFTGNIVELTINGFNAVSTDLQADLTADTTKLFVKSSDRFAGYSTGNNVPTTTPELVLAVAQAALKISWTLSDLKLNVEQVIPPKTYTNQVVSKMKSKSGYLFNFKHISLKRINIQGVNGALSAQIPIGQEGNRVYSLNVMPLKAVDVFNENNLVCDNPDYAEDYQWLINNQNVPDQRCDLKKLSQVPAKTNQLHTQELRKSLVNCGISVRNLQNPQSNFIIGRAVSDYGHTSNIRGSDVALRVSYGTSATIQKVFNVYICSQRTLVIKDDAMMVVD